MAFWSTKQTLKKVSKPSDLIQFDWDDQSVNELIDDRTPEEKLKDIKKVWEKIDNGSTDS
ncbi:hypothetical protein [Aquimarina sp. 2201CG14-23]|uniref:hypothetical protein n=1 Tax=Aquimarina mycalae TaxID=3040073 RepID=UPI0024782B6B|nr:hypothetical protein [Aquimarina sp. 2201CG14-23]MDH7444679.1 hypothetical protein [Aquimarina sp. 2201CG14-23]